MHIKNMIALIASNFQETSATIETITSDTHEITDISIKNFQQNKEIIITGQTNLLG